jgi:hypothetical protein
MAPSLGEAMEEQTLIVPFEDNVLVVPGEDNVFVVPADPPEKDDKTIVVDRRGPSWF